MEKRDFYLYSIIGCVVAGCIMIFIPFLFYYNEILESLMTIEGAWGVLIVLIFRIILLSIMAYYVLNEWFKQEEQYTFDIPFLFGIFLILLTFGKALDLFWDFTYFRFSEEIVLFILKIRYFIIIIELAPLLYIGFGIILYSFSFKERYQHLSDQKTLNKVRLKLILLIIIIELFAIAISPHRNIVAILLPLFLIPSLAGIVYIFFFAYKHKRLSQIHPLIVGFGFFLYMISSILRPVFMHSFGETSAYLIFAEIIDIIVFIVIFIGLYLNADYNRN